MTLEDQILGLLGEVNKPLTASQIVRCLREGEAGFYRRSSITATLTLMTQRCNSPVERSGSPHHYWLRRAATA